MHTFLTFHSHEGDLLAFLQAFEASALDRAVVHKQVRTVFRGDEAEAFFIVEPLDGASLTFGHESLLEQSLHSAGTARAVTECKE